MLRLKNKKAEEKAAEEEKAAAALVAATAVAEESDGPGSGGGGSSGGSEPISVIDGLGGKSVEVKKGKKKRTPGEIRIQKGALQNEENVSKEKKSDRDEARKKNF